MCVSVCVCECICAMYVLNLTLIFTNTLLVCFTSSAFFMCVRHASVCRSRSLCPDIVDDGVVVVVVNGCYFPRVALTFSCTHTHTLTGWAEK